MSIPLQRLEFDEFFAYWKNSLKASPEMLSCADVVWHEYEWGVASSKLRQKFGILTWLAWWLLNTSSNVLRRPKLSTDQPIFQQTTFAVLPTPAHSGTLLPVIQDFRKWGQNCQSIGQHENCELSISSIASLLSLRDSVQCLLQTLKAIKKAVAILKTGERELHWTLSGRLAERIFDCLAALYSSQKLGIPDRELFLTYELLPWQKGLAWHWRQHGQRVIHIMHGQLLPTYQVTMATDLVLFSKIDATWFRTRVDPSVRIWTTGHPRLENIRGQVAPPPAHTHRLPRIAFFSQPVEGNYSRQLRRADWKLLAPLTGKAEVRFRAHPRETQAELRKEMAETGIEFVEISDAGLVEDLRWCDAVASSWSTVSMEAAACGRGIFWTCTTPERYEPSKELRDHGIGVLIDDGEKWDNILQQWYRGEWAVPIVVPEDRLRELGMIGDMEKSWAERLEIEF